MNLLPSKSLLAGLFFSSLLFTSCNITGQLYPVSGPLSKSKPLPVITLTVEGVQANSGDASLTLPSGEECKGRWSVVAPRMTGVVTSSGVGTISNGLDTVFVHVHGQSFINASLPGINRGQAMLTGNRGTVIEAAFLVGSGTASGYGVATDSNGNTYKVIF